MKHLFILNPAAGKRDQIGEFTQKIRTVCDRRGVPYEILVSRSAGDCTRIAAAAAASNEALRLYACGGDGTLNEVVNGVAEFKNVAITHFPGGSGNDFIKIFSDPSAFSDLDRLLDGEEAQFDLIRCQDKIYALNVCSVGLDARVGTEVAKYKRLPLVSGPGAYFLSVGANLIKGLHAHYVIEIDGKVIDGHQTMICIANGRWYGGSFHPVPTAEPDDGLLDVLLVHKVSRLTIARALGKYKNGQFSEFPNLIEHFRCKRIVVHCDQKSEINLDGELLVAKDVVFEAVPQSLRFFYPKGLTYSTANTTNMQAITK